MKNKTQSISDNIRSLREKRGYSQEYMSELLDVSQQTYSLIEKRPEKTNLERIEKIASILEVKISFLLNEEDSYVLNSINQRGGYAASTISTHSNEMVYKKIIENLEEEVKFLKTLIQKDKYQND